MKEMKMSTSSSSSSSSSSSRPRLIVLGVVAFLILLLFVFFSGILQSQQFFPSSAAENNKKKHSSHHHHHRHDGKDNSNKNTKKSAHEEWQEFLKNRTDQDQTLSCHQPPWSGSWAGSEALSELLLSSIKTSISSDNENNHNDGGGEKDKDDEREKEENEWTKRKTKRKQEIIKALLGGISDLTEQQEALRKHKEQHERFLKLLSKYETRKMCRPQTPKAFEEFADVATINSPSFLCPPTKLVDKNLRWSNQIPQSTKEMFLTPPSSSSSSSSSSVQQQKTLKPACPTQLAEDFGVTLVECALLFSSSGNASFSPTEIFEKILEFEEEDISRLAESSSLLLETIHNLLRDRQQFGWPSSSSSSSSASSSSSSSSSSNSSSSSSGSSSSFLCPIEELSGGILASIRADLLKDRTDYELALLTESAFVVPFAPPLQTSPNLPYFFNSHGDSDQEVKFPSQHTETTFTTGGFPTFEISGPQPAVSVAVFTKAVVGYSYVFTCDGRAFGNGGAKEHRFEFAGREVKSASRLPCKPFASLFPASASSSDSSSSSSSSSVATKPSVPVAIPLCTSRYCRWYGIYHFMLEHLPQLACVLDVFSSSNNNNHAAYLVVTEHPSLTTRSLLVDAMGIPANRIIVGPVKADVALLPTPGLIYRPQSHALRILRRVILSRMGLEWKATVSDEASFVDPYSPPSENSKNNKRNSRKDRKRSVSTSSAPPASFSSVLSPRAPAMMKFAIFKRRYCSPTEPEIRILFSERGTLKATAEQKQLRLPKNWQKIKNDLRRAFPCARFQTEKEVREDVRDTIFSFYEADIVLGVHGANLLFTSFMRRGAHLIEMITADVGLNPRCFYHLASEVGVRYNAILHDGGFKLKEYSYNLDPAMVVRRVNASAADILRQIIRK